MPHRRLIWRILAAMLLVSVLPIGIGAYLQQRQITEELTAANERQMTLKVESAYSEISHYVNEALLVLKSTAALPEIKSMDAKQQLPALTAVDQENADMAGLIVTDLTGMNVARSDGNALVSVAERAYFKDVAGGKEYAFQTVLSKVSGKPTLIVAVPVKKDGKTAGVLYTNLQLDKVSKFVDQIKMGQTGYVWMADADDKIMTHPDPEKVKSQASVKEHPAIGRARSDNPSPVTWTENGKVWTSVEKLLPQGWILVLQMDEAEALAPIARGRELFTWVILSVLAVGFVLAILVARSLTAPIQQMAHFVGGMAQGDFTGELKLRRADEIGFMADALRRMQGSLRQHVLAVRTAISDVGVTGRELVEASSMAAHSQEAIAAAFSRTLSEVERATGQQREQLDSSKAAFSELVSAIGQIANTASHQAEEVGRASNVVHDVLDRANAVASSIDRITLSAERASESAAAGQSTVEGALSGIRATRDHVDQAARTIRELGARSEAISTILAEISAIADQTNLLALNAAIEAARAGEAGRGFAVVAEEVRKLADRSVGSAQEINKILASVHSGVKDAVTVMEQGTISADQSTERANEAQQALGEILLAVETSVAEARKVHESAQHMSVGYQQLSSTTQTLAAVTEENSAAAEEMAAGSETVRASILKLDTLATQNFAAITGVTGDLDNISRAVQRMVEVARQLETVSASLEASASNLKG